ncbi:MAG: biopolymer transporter ExbD [Betaproteobacteria bacterium]|nr:MAG: biopolymer transporter ExbD [Betaproteobacteria bacterium]
MAMTVGPGEGGDDELVASINTTPLVDVMLVLLIIFLITIPVVIHLVPLELPKERNQVRQTKPENISISVNRDGDIFWGLTRITDNEDLVRRLKEKSVLNPQPEVHIRGDLRARYESIGRVVFGCQRAGIVKVNFIIEPPVAGG